LIKASFWEKSSSPSSARLDNDNDNGNDNDNDNGTIFCYNAEVAE
jgi:hypothetical protein